MNKKYTNIIVLENAITVTPENYISLTDMLKAKDRDFFISDWLRNRNTVEYLGIWERVHNPDFNYGEFATIKSLSGLNSYKISVKGWVEKTNAIGITIGDGIALLNGPTEFGLKNPKAVQFTIDSKRKCRPLDILFCVRGSLTGRMNWADKEYSIGRGLAAILSKRK